MLKLAPPFPHSVGTASSSFSATLAPAISPAARIMGFAPPDGVGHGARRRRRRRCFDRVVRTVILEAPFARPGHMIRPSKLYLAVAFAASFLAIGLRYWALPYNRLSLPSALVGPGLIVVGVSALLLRTFGVASLRRITMVIGASVPCAVLARVIIDALKDPTSHNLWPLEVIIALVIGIPVALGGSTAGAVIARLFGPATRAKQS
jgi:hypothetical protein